MEHGAIYLSLKGAFPYMKLKYHILDYRLIKNVKESADI